VSQYLYLLIDRALFIVSAVTFIGVVVVVQQLVRGLRHGFSIRSQLFLVLALSTFVLSSLLAGALLVGEMDQASFFNLLPQVAFVVLALTGAAAISGIVVARTLARPIERLTRASLRIAAGERQAALPMPRGKEVRELTRAFESMRRELEERDAMEGLASDLWHELKNPVAAIRASAEVLDDAIGEDPEAARRFSRRILEASDRLDALTRDLLDLTRLEAKGLADPDAAVDLSAVVREAVESQRAVAQAAGVTLVAELPPRADTRGDARWLRTAVENLVRNAVVFSPQDAEVRITLEATVGAWQIRVDDQGPGVEPAIRDRLFERFVGSRHGEGGTGLGLAIVRAVAEAHGGEAVLVQTGETGSVFGLEVPR
jgi:two-component system, OmpR family, sensor histidine kinase CreC